MTTKTPTISYGDSYTLGQVAQQWAKPTVFVKRMVAEGKLVQDERGLVTNAALRDFYAVHGTDLDD